VSENFAGLIAAVARRHPERIALRWDGGALTYGELVDRVEDTARRLRAGGLRPGERLAVAIPNCPEFVTVVLGGIAAGAIVAPLDVLLKADERAAILADLRPARLVEKGPGGERSSGDAIGDGDGCIVHAMAGAAPPADAPAALVLYTSGSTGRPKGALLSHRALTIANQSWAGPVIGLRDGDVLLAALPLSHAFGINGALFAPLLAGATVALIERFVPETVAGLLEGLGVTVLPGVATMFRRLLDVPGFRGGRGLRLGVSGAAPCPWDLAQEWRARTGVRIIRGYGMTELFRPLSYSSDDPTDHAECVGRAVPGVDIRVVDDDGRTLPAGESGELHIRTPAAMDGYLDSPEDTRAVFDGGWFRTGDLARVTADGYVAIVGRLRERIKRGGYSVFPAEVEAVVLAHPAVAEAAAVGMPDAALGEEIAAFVTLRPGVATDADELIAWCRERLAAYKYPRRVVIVPELPKSSTGKILRARLR
jgi:long-chain acyl-CoA synthetase